MCGTTKAKKSCLFIFLIPHRGTCSALFTIRVAKLWEFWKLSMENTQELLHTDEDESYVVEANVCNV